MHRSAIFWRRSGYPRSFEVWALLYVLIVSAVDTASGIEPATNEERKQSPLVVRPAYGLPACYLGMPITRLDGRWKRVAGDDAKELEEYRQNPDAGLSILHKDGKIEAVFIYLFSREHKPFTGRIQGGITSESSVRDVIDEYGQPTNISVTTGSQFAEYPGAKYVELDYLIRGIQFTFVDGKLHEVTIHRPIDDYQPSLAEDTGDTAEYRAIVPKKSGAAE